MKDLYRRTYNWVKEFVKREDGPTAVEYAVMLALIIVVCIAAITSLGKSTNSTFSFVGSAGQLHRGGGVAADLGNEPSHPQQNAQRLDRVLVVVDAHHPQRGVGERGKNDPAGVGQGGRLRGFGRADHEPVRRGGTGRRQGLTRGRGWDRADGAVTTLIIDNIAWREKGSACATAGPSA